MARPEAEAKVFVLPTPCPAWNVRLLAEMLFFPRLARFDSHRCDDTIEGMIAMADIRSLKKDFMTVREVMGRIDARAHSTVLRLIRIEGDPKTSGRPLQGINVPGHGWFILRKSVDDFCAVQAAKAPGVGFPRGRPRKAESGQPAAKKAAKKTAARKKTPQ